MRHDPPFHPYFDDVVEAPPRPGDIDPPIRELAGSGGPTRRLGRRELIARQLMCAGVVLLSAPALWIDHQAHRAEPVQESAAATSAVTATDPSVASGEPAREPAPTATATDSTAAITVEPVATITTEPAPQSPNAPVTTITPQPTTTATVRTEAQFLQCVRHRESRGNYTAVNPQSGTGGAYQFHQQTWDTMARLVNRSDLVGVRPEQATPAAQDQLAHVLYVTEGRTPWGGFCAVTS